MARRRIAEEPMSQAAVWARRLALFALAAATLSLLMINFDMLEVTSAISAVAGVLAFAGIAILFAFAAFVVIWREGTDGFGSAMLALFIGILLLGYPAFLAIQAYRLPPITDVVTDPENPPRFETIAQLRRTNPVAYPGRAVAEKQRAAYPDVEPLVVTSTPEQAYEAALALMTKRKWLILGQRAPQTRVAGRNRTVTEGRIEAVARTQIIGLREDVVLRVSADGEGARVDMRSASRYGQHDFGSNASRITKFLDEVDEILGVQAEKKAAPKRPAQVAKPAPAKR